MTRRRVASLVGCSAIAALLLGGCVVPARDDGAYREDASESLQSASSELATADLAVRSWLAGRLTRNATDVVVTDAESAIGPIDVAFGGGDPPGPASDETRDTVVSLLGDAQDALSQTRIAVRRDDATTARAALKQLREVAAELTAETGRLG